MRVNRAITGRRARIIMSLAGIGAVAAVVALSPNAQPALASPPTAAATPNHATDAERHAVELRRQYGFRSDLEHVRAVEARANGLERRYGIPLLPKEVRHAEVLRRATIGADNVKAELVESNDGSFAGMWMRAGKLHVSSVTPLSDDKKAKLGSHMPSESPIAFETARYTQGELQDLMRQVERDMPQLRAEGVTIVLLAVSDEENVVRIELSGEATGMESLLESRYNASGMLHVTGNAPPFETQGTTETRDYPYGVAYGGQWMNKYGPNCTIGVANATNSAGNKYIVTAGHCGPVGTIWKMGNEKKGPGEDLGRTVKNFWTSGGTTACDCQLVGPLPGGKSTSAVRGYNNVPYYYQATARDSASYWGGRSICVSGAQSAESYSIDGITCTSINHPGTTVYHASNNTTYTNQVITEPLNSYPTLGGDSGAPWGSDTVFMGIHSSKQDGTNRAHFSKAPEAGKMNVSFKY